MFIKDLDKRSEEELDYIYRPRTSNSRSSLLSAYILTILLENSNQEKRLSASDISNLLEEKYELDTPNKTLRRYLNTMLRENMHIYANEDMSEFWYDSQRTEENKISCNTITNSDKSLIPVYIINVLKENTDWNHRLNPKQITELITKKYELEVDVKAVRRHLHTLAPTEIGLWTDEYQREFWYSEKKPDWWEE